MPLSYAHVEIRPLMFRWFFRKPYFFDLENELSLSNGRPLNARLGSIFCQPANPRPAMANPPPFHGVSHHLPTELSWIQPHNAPK